ncbi:MAG: DUF502 domain-containing protein [Verrucomicrobiota bacterium]
MLAPLAVTIWAFLRIISFFGSVLPDSVREQPGVGLLWDALATVVMVGLIALLGWLSRYVLGKYLLGVGDRFIREIPGVSAVYNTVKQIVATFGRQGRSSYSKVVLVEFPRAGVWTLGFLTNESPGEAQAALGGEVWAVFVPTTPNPTSGFLVLVPRRAVVELEMNVADGMKMIISGGAIVPPWPADQKSSASAP